MRPQAAQAVIYSDEEFEPDVTGNDSDEISSESDDSDRDEEDEPVVKKLRKLTKAQRLELQKLKEQAQKFFEEKIPIDVDSQDPDHFERLLSSNPNSSFIWTKYMDLHVHARDFEKVTAIGNRAVSAIDTKEEQEKLNVWTTLSRFELYGTKESFVQTANEALLSNGEYKIAYLVLDLCANLKRIKVQDKKDIKKKNKEFSDSIDAYLQCVFVYFTLKKTAKARLVLQNALSDLPTKSHVTIISEFAVMENNHGSPEEAQTLFEDILTCYPSRIDIWKLYVDMLIKSNNMDLARHAFERAAIQKQVAPEKMTRLFTKWMMFEEEYGTPESIIKVQESLFNYIQT